MNTPRIQTHDGGTLLRNHKPIAPSRRIGINHARTRSNRLLLGAVIMACLSTPSLRGETQPAGQLRGPKHTIAVSRFTANQAFMNQYGNWDIGGGLSAMLTTALEQSGKFIVVERENLSDVLSEQTLAANGLVRPESGAKAGNLLGAQLLIMGSVTSFDENNKGGGFGIGFGGSKNIPIIGGLAPKISSGSVGIDFKIVDATSGEVLETHTVKESLKKFAIAAEIKYQNIDFGGDQFKKTPIGQAMRNAIQEAVRRIEAKAASVKWSGRVIDTDEDGSVFLNAGTNAGLSEGNDFTVLRASKELRDPATGQLLGVRKRKLGKLTIKEVFENYSIGTFTSDQQGAVAKGGDLVEAL